MKLFILIFINMNRLDKCQILKEKGYTYNSETGKIYGIFGKEITGKDKKGYIVISSNHIKGQLLGHHLAWFITYGNVDFIELDHEDRNKSNNRICNLRISNRIQQTQNVNCKGFTKTKNNKFAAQIVVNYKHIWLGTFDTEQQARQAYLDAKKLYHNI